MGIYIKDMNKPSSCIECPFFQRSIYGGKCIIITDVYRRSSGEDISLPDCSIQDWCPLIYLFDDEVE